MNNIEDELDSFKDNLKKLTEQSQNNDSNSVSIITKTHDLDSLNIDNKTDYDSKKSINENTGDINKPIHDNNYTASENIYLELYRLSEMLKQKEEKNKSLEKSNKILLEENKNLKKNLNKFRENITLHESKLRELFKLYYNDKHKLYRYQRLVNRLEVEYELLKEKLEFQEDKFDKLKNQMSYRLGNRIVKTRKPREVISLPKEVIKDYIDYKTNKSKSVVSSKSRSSKLTFNTDYNDSSFIGLYENNLVIPIETKLHTIVMSNELYGKIITNLYGVKSHTKVKVEVYLESIDGRSVIRRPTVSGEAIYLLKGEKLIIKEELSSDCPLCLFEILNIEYSLKVGFLKVRGVPSFIRLNEQNKTKSEFINIDPQENLKCIKNTEVPKLKKKNNEFVEASEISLSEGYDTAKNFVEKYVDRKLHSSLHIIKANLNINSDTEWLKSVNSYLKKFNLREIELNNEEKKRFFRLSCKLDSKVEDKTKISVIMPAYNSEKTIEHSIRSILNQSWKNLELIVINDASTDNTSRVVSSLSEFDDRIIAIDNPVNVGPYVSKNLGLKIASGDYITGHDADDWAHPQRLEKHIQFIRRESIPPRASITRMIRMNEDGLMPLYRTSDFCRDGVLRIASITCMFESNFLKNILGGWDCARFGADSEIISRSKIYLEDEFKDFDTFSMICLDNEFGLTNHPVHGISKTSGISTSRKFYKKQWQEWHNTLKDRVYLEFPHLNRKFEVPEGTEIPLEDILKVSHNITKYIS